MAGRVPRAPGACIVRAVAPVLVLLALAAASASAQSAEPEPDSGDARASAKHGSQYVLTAAELASVKANNLYDAIHKLRPRFLRSTRGTGSITKLAPSSTPTRDNSGDPSYGDAPAGNAPLPVRVYLDGNRLEGLDELKRMNADQVKEIRYMPGPEAAVRYGTDHGGGVLLLTSK